MYEVFIDDSRLVNGNSLEERCNNGIQKGES